MKILLSLLLLFLGFIAQGQNLNEQLSKVKTIKQANNFIKSNPTLSGELVSFTSFVDTASVAKQLLDKEEGFILSAQDHTYKIVKAEAYPLFRASYIYLDGSKLSKSKIDRLRKEIIEKYNAGTPFANLVSQYTMDSSKKNGDLGWFKEGVMAKGFETAVKEHKAGELFTIDLPQENWFYVTLKTHNDRKIKTITALKIKGQ